MALPCRASPEQTSATRLARASGRTLLASASCKRSSPDTFASMARRPTKASMRRPWTKENSGATSSSMAPRVLSTSQRRPTPAGPVTRMAPPSSPRSLERLGLFFAPTTRAQGARAFGAAARRGRSERGARKSCRAGAAAATGAAGAAAPPGNRQSLLRASCRDRTSAAASPWEGRRG